MLYVDTSVLVPLFVPEPESADIRNWFDKQTGEVLAISDWTLTEFASAMGIKVRDKGLKPDQAREAYVLLEKLATESLKVFTPKQADYALAADYLGQYGLGLRAGDALHLAIAENEGAKAIYSLDRQFVRAGRKLKLRAASPM